MEEKLKKVLTGVNKIMLKDDSELAIILSLSTVVKLHRIAKADLLEAQYLNEEDGSWTDCLIIEEASCKNRRFISQIICSMDF